MDKYALKQFIWCVRRDLPCWNNWVGTTWSDDPKEEKAENAFDWSLYGPNSHLSELRSRREHRSLPHSPPYLPLLSSLLLSSPLLSYHPIFWPNSKHLVGWLQPREGCGWGKWKNHNNGIKAVLQICSFWTCMKQRVKDKTDRAMQRKGRGG